MKTKTSPTLYWAVFAYDHWNLAIAATSGGLCYVGSQNKPIEEMALWAKSRFPGSPLVQDEEALQPYSVEMIEYFQGKRKSFAFSFDLRGTDFQLAVWNALREIPYGETQSYSDIANHIKKPASVRAVGAAIGANPVLISVPCHRVVGKSGSLTGYRGGMDMKTQLLRLEKDGMTGERSRLHG